MSWFAFSASDLQSMLVYYSITAAHADYFSFFESFSLFLAAC